MTTQSTAEAMAVLKKHRAYLIEQARIIAFELASAHGSVHVRDVRDEMIRRGFIEKDARRLFWFGAVFNRNPVFRPVGTAYRPPVTSDDAQRNIHGNRAVEVWEINQ